MVKRDGKVHRETRTFDRRSMAASWVKKREKELGEPGALAKPKAEDPTLADAIDRYVRESRKAIGATKAQVIRSIKGYPIAERSCSQITNAEIAAFMQELGPGRQPSTVGNYISHLSAVMNAARDLWGWPVSSTAMKETQRGARTLGVIAKSNKRTRLPTLDELDRLMRHFGDIRARRPSSLPMQRIVAFALYSTRRQEEIVRIAWPDLDEPQSQVLVRDMKNPGDKIGNHVWCKLPPEALAMIQAMPRSGDRIFPFSTDAVSASFTRACKVLGIADLRFHDLRHAGISRLFEMGNTLPIVASTSGHRSWQSLQRYTHLGHKGDRFAGWPWLKVVTEPME